MTNLIHDYNVAAVLLGRPQITTFDGDERMLINLVVDMEAEVDALTRPHLGRA